jgi:hypothetical protein
VVGDDIRWDPLPTPVWGEHHHVLDRHLCLDRPGRARCDNDEDVARRLPAGSTGLAAIFTDHIKAAHVIRRVLLRQTAIINYVNPF